MYDRLLVLHVLGATGFIGIAVALSLLCSRLVPPCSFSTPLGRGIALASMVALVFGVWLAIYVVMITKPGV